jgi:general nucleoside transport system ATP-binding protein
MEEGSAQSKVPLVEMRDIVKRFPGVLANDGANLELLPGEVHALLGENGAGKSTLMNILSGLYKHDSGEILVEGLKYEFGSARDALRAGIGMVHQHFALVDIFSVAENVTLGLDIPRIHLNMNVVEEQVAELGRKYNLGVDPRAKIWQLSVGEQQRVEILKLLYRNAKVLILDEPTSVLTPQESAELSETLHRMAETGQGILYISHKLNEVCEVAERVTIIREGRNVATLDREEIEEKHVARLMLGADVSALEIIDRAKDPGEVLLELDALNVTSDRGLPAVKDVHLAVRSGSVLGLAGVAGNGQRELAESIAGLRIVESGKVRIAGVDLTNKHVRKIIDAGMSLIPEDRMGTGLVPSLDVSQNAILRGYWDKRFSGSMMLDWKKVNDYTEELVDDFNVKTPTINEAVWKLSGGNQQRLLLAREMTSNPRVVVANHPTSGLDVQAAMDVHNLLIAQRDRGAAILLISEDLDELIALSDAIVVMYGGEVSLPIAAEKADRHELGLLMMGAGLEKQA